MIAGAHLLAAWSGQTVDAQAMADLLLPAEPEEEDATTQFERLARALGAEEIHGDAG